MNQSKFKQMNGADAKRGENVRGGVTIGFGFGAFFFSFPFFFGPKLAQCKPKAMRIIFEPK